MLPQPPSPVPLSQGLAAAKAWVAEEGCKALVVLEQQEDVGGWYLEQQSRAALGVNGHAPVRLVVCVCVCVKQIFDDLR